MEIIQNNKEMKKYRIVTGEGYDGCVPITVYWVQVREDGFFGSKWRNVKGFDSRDRAEELLDILTNKRMN